MCSLPAPYSSQCPGAWEALNSALTSTTGIPHRVLDFGHLWSTSVEERAKWIQGRTTQKVEDTTYCLLGIFGIYMPLLYGEGDQAWSRLEDEVSKKYKRNIRLPLPLSMLLADMINYDKYTNGLPFGFVTNVALNRPASLSHRPSGPSSTAPMDEPAARHFSMRNWLASPPDIFEIGLMRHYDSSYSIPSDSSSSYYGIPDLVESNKSIYPSINLLGDQIIDPNLRSDQVGLPGALFDGRAMEDYIARQDW